MERAAPIAHRFHWRVTLLEIHTLLKSLRSIVAEAEDDSRAQPYIVLPVAVAAAVDKLRIEILCLKQADTDPGA
jgi:hypothetical protein